MAWLDLLSRWGRHTLYFFAFLNFGSLSSGAEVLNQNPNRAQYPRISKVMGKAWVTEAKGVRTRLKAPYSVRNNTSIETDKNSQVEFELSAGRKLTLLEKTKIEVPAITWETMEFSYVKLESGELLWESKEAEGGFALLNDLIHLPLSTGFFLFLYDPTRSTVEVRVFQGSQQFLQMNGERVVTVEKGKKMSFTGIRSSDGAVEYDILLNGKKIPKGKLSMVEDLTKLDWTPQEKLLQAQRRLEKKKETEKKLAASFLCANPFGQLNECAWICEGNPKGTKYACRLEVKGVDCVRYRCNANGEWAERQVLEGAKRAQCSVAPIVQACDY